MSQSAQANTRLIAGCMTGTSLDGLDVALVRITGAGLGMHAEFVCGASHSLESLGLRLRALAEQRPHTAGEIALLASDFGLLHSRALQALIKSAAVPRIDLTSVHGQTVFHEPPLSWQMINPTTVAHELKCPVVFDLRAADLAAGGQGAPITPLADWVLFRHPTEARAIVNLGGFCNITLIPSAAVVGKRHSDADLDAWSQSVRGLDVCACNHILDALARTLFDAPFDEGGRRAQRGTPDAQALSDLRALLSGQGRAGRSLGTGDELGGWLERCRTNSPNASADDLAATACRAIADTVAKAVQTALPGVRRVLIAGGGAKNAALTAALAAACGTPVEATDHHGVPASYREAAEMAVLGALCQDRIPITLPAVTGVPSPAPVSGVWAGFPTHA